MTTHMMSHIAHFASDFHSFVAVMSSHTNTNDKLIKQLRASIKKILPVIKRNVLQLNNKLPESVAYFWVTTEEMYNQLIIAGVSRRLHLDHFKEAAQRFNVNEIYSWKPGRNQKHHTTAH